MAAEQAAAAEAARVAAEHAAAAQQQSSRGTSGDGRGTSTGGTSRPAPAPVSSPPPAPAPQPLSTELYLSGKTCSFDGSRFHLGFTAKHAGGQLYITVPAYAYASGSPALSSLDGHMVIGGNFVNVDQCID